MEHRGDVSDQATAAEERALGLALAVQRKKAQEKAPVHFNGEDCSDCEGTMMPARLELGFFRCIECQTAIEKIIKQRR